MPASRLILTAASTAASVLALTASADAATLTTLPCVPVVTTGIAQTMPVAGTGYTPGATVTVRFATKLSPTPTYLAATTADAAGNFSLKTYPAPFHKFDTQEQQFVIGATDGVNPAIISPPAIYRQTRISYRTNPLTGRPSRKALHTVRGFPVGKSTYLHFRFQGVTKRNVKLGVTKGPCGKVSKRMRLLPTRSHPGRWTVYADQSKTYHKGTTPQLKYGFTITRSFG